MSSENNQVASEQQNTAQTSVQKTTRQQPRQMSRGGARTMNRTARRGSRGGVPDPAVQAKMLAMDHSGLEQEADANGKQVASASTNSGNVIQAKEDVKGEVGLKNGTTKRDADGGVTVAGEIAGGKKMRPMHYDSEADYAQSEEGIEDLQENVSTHAFMEFVAHFLAYREEDYDPPGNIEQIIQKAGYDPDYLQVKMGGLGFQYVYLESQDPTKNSVLGIRGTNAGLAPSDVATVYADLDPTSVGMQQYNFNKKLIIDLLNKGNGNLDITGHSLGGAVAQIITAYHPDKISRLYTFQSPGIDDTQVANYKKHPEKERPEVYHHVAVGDMVDKAGEMNLPGEVFVHDFGLPYIKVQDFFKEGRDVLKSINHCMSGVALESITITRKFYQLAKQMMNPLCRDDKIAKIQEEIRQDIVDMHQYMQLTKGDIIAFLNLLRTVAESVGEAHTTHLFSSGNFEKGRMSTGLDDEYYTNKDENAGAQMDASGQPSVVTAHSAYPFMDERPTAESARDIAGILTYTLAHPLHLMVLRQIMEDIIETLNTIERIVDQIMQQIELAANSAWEAIIEIPEKIEGLYKDLLDAIENLKQYRKALLN